MIECEAFLGGSKLLPPEKLKEKPRWLVIDDLHAEQFQFFGVEILALLK